MTNKIKLGIILGGALILSACGEQITTNNNQVPTTTNNVANQEISTTTKYTLEEIAKHNQPEDCWMIIEGQAYNLTDYIKSEAHPGGPKINKGCGLDATEMFNKIPGHAETKEMLNKYLLQ